MLSTKNFLVHWKLGIILCLVFFCCFSCVEDAKVENKYSIDFQPTTIKKKIQYYNYTGNPFPKYYFSEKEDESYIYLTEPSFHQYILKFKVEGDETYLVDSLEIPVEVFGKHKGKLHDFFVVKDDHFVIVPYRRGYSDSTSFYELKPNNDLNKYTYFNYINRYYTNINMQNVSSQNVMFNNLIFCGLGYSYSGDPGELNQYGSPLFTQFKSGENENVSFGKYPKYLKERVQDHFGPMSTMIDHKLVVNFKVENAFHVYDMNTGEYDVIEFNNPFLDEVINEETKDDPKQQMFETDFYARLVYNPQLEKLILIQHEAEDYYMDNNIDVKGFEQAEKRILVFDKKLNIEGYAIMNKNYYSFGMIYPTKDGFVNVRSGNYKGDFIFDEFKINELNKSVENH